MEIMLSLTKHVFKAKTASLVAATAFKQEGKVSKYLEPFPIKRRWLLESRCDTCDIFTSIRTLDLDTPYPAG